MRKITLVSLVLLVFLAAVVYLGVYLAAPKRSSELGDGGHLLFIGSALNDYSREHGTLLDNIYNKNGKPLLSWRVVLLQYGQTQEVEQYKEFHLDEPWDSPHNLDVAKKIPETYRDPRDSRFTPYLAVTGDTAVFRPHKPRDWKPLAVGTIPVLGGDGGDCRQVGCSLDRAQGHINS